MALCHNGNIVWVNGPFKCGLFPDLKIFNLGLKNYLGKGEKVIADLGYSSPVCVTKRRVSINDKRLHRRLRARDETVNSRLKNFFILKNTFRHHHNLHAYCFHAVAQITSMMISHSDPLFSL